MLFIYFVLRTHKLGIGLYFLPQVEIQKNQNFQMLLQISFLEKIIIFYNNLYLSLTISTLRNDFTANNQDILRLKIRKILRIWLKKFCEFQ